jgi:hypothetical protein
VQRRGLAEFWTAAFGVSIRRACRVLRFNLSTYFYRHRRDEPAALVLRLKELSTSPNECWSMDFVAERLASVGTSSGP